MTMKSMRWARGIFVTGTILTGVSLYAGCGGSGTSPVAHSGNGNMSRGPNGISQADLSQPCSSRTDCIWPFVCAYPVLAACPTFDTVNLCAQSDAGAPVVSQCVLMQNPTLRSFCACSPDNNDANAKPFSAWSDGNYAPVIATSDTSLCLAAGQTGPALKDADLIDNGQANGETVCK